MAYTNLTAASAINVQTGRIRKVVITVNKALTGNIIVSDETGTAGTPVVATITNPAVGDRYEYWDFKTGVSITPSATCDITVNVDGSFGPK